MGASCVRVMKARTAVLWRRQSSNPGYLDQHDSTVPWAVRLASFYLRNERIGPFIGADSLLAGQFTIHSEIGPIEANDFAKAVGPLEAEEERL